MPKLQQIKRSNGSVVSSVNLPLELIQELEWEKGTELKVEILDHNNVKSIHVMKVEQ